MLLDSTNCFVSRYNKDRGWRNPTGLCTNSPWQGVSLVGEQERSTTWVLYTVNKKGSETRRGVKRCFEDQSSSVQISGTITPVEAPTPCNETPQARNTNMLPLEDGTQPGKKMHCDVQSDVLRAVEMPLSCSFKLGSFEYEFTLTEFYGYWGRRGSRRSCKRAKKLPLQSTINKKN